MAGTTRSATEEDLFAALDALAERYGSPGATPDDSLDRAIDQTLSAFDVLLEHVNTLPDVLQLSRLADFERRISARRLAVAARVAGCSGDSRSDRRRARDALSDGTGSSRAVSRDAKRAATMAANPGLGDAVIDGAIAPDAVDHLAKAADMRSGEVPSELVQAVDGLTVDQTADVVDRYLEDRVNAKEVEKRYQQQMKARSVRRYRKTGLAGIAIEGPDQLIDAMWAHLDVAIDEGYRAEGGRDAPVDQRRAIDHRRFDAAHAALTGQASASSGGRAAVVITVDGDRLFGEPDSPVAGVQLGSGPLPEDVVAEYLNRSAVSFLVRRTDGSPLWLGRSRRRATDQLFLALAVRDRGCVLCRSSVTRCQAHHLMPWHAPGRGQTDVDKMALLCGRCHGDLHHRNHTLYRQRGPDGKPIWATRPATPNETPRRRPTPTQRE